MKEPIKNPLTEIPPSKEAPAQARAVPPEEPGAPPGFDWAEFQGQVTGYRYALRRERKVKEKIKAAMTSLGAAAMNICSYIETELKENTDSREATVTTQLITYEVIDDAVFIRAQKRRLTFAILYGVGSDRNLAGSRDEKCGQIGAFVHLADQDWAYLCSRLQIYGNGDVSDGKRTWNLGDGPEAFLPYLASSFQEFIFDIDTVWQKTADLPVPFSKVQVVDGDVFIESLRRTAVSIHVPEQKRDQV